MGLIVTEGTYVGHESAGQSDRVPRFHGEEQLAGWAKVADAVHAAGGTIVPQLWHIGMVRKQGEPPFADAPAVGPSGIRVDGTEGTGKAMTQQRPGRRHRRVRRRPRRTPSASASTASSCTAPTAT